MLGEQGKRIARLKAQPAGVARDYQLAAALRDNQGLATRLTQLGAQIRIATDELRNAYGAAIARARDPEQRRQLEQRLARLNAAGSHIRIVTKEKVNPLDSADDLNEKADLLQDSEEKVRRQLRQVQAQLAQLEHRVKLQRHSKSVDDNPFVEESPRRTGQAKRSTLESAPAGGGTARATTPPSPGALADSSAEVPAGFTGSAKTNSPAPPPSGAGDTSYAGVSGRGGLEVIVSIRDVMDPSILNDLKQSTKSDTLTARLAALKKASGRLRQVADQLSNQSKQLRRRASQLRTQK
jgi:prefoldin subunit 5